MNKIIKIALTAFLGIFLLSCEKDDDNYTDSTATNHVILVYLGGDNNLSSETYQKIEAIREGWQGGSGKKLLIYTDPADTNPSLIEIVKENGQNIKKIIRNYDEENSASKEVLSRVIGEVTSLYPSPSYGFVVFSHASGWLPQSTLTSPRSIIMDKKQEMELSDFAQAIPDNTFDYIIFEACFMTGIEVAYELKDKADYILASSAEILSPGFTYIYPKSINHLSGSLSGLQAFGEDAFIWFDNKAGYMRSATFSIIRTSQLDPLANWIKNNCDQAKQVNISEIQHFDRYSYRLFFDFEDYYASLLKTDNQKSELSTLISNCVVWKNATPAFMKDYNGFDIKKHSGLTTYIPQKKYSFLNEEYKKLKWYKSSAFESDFEWIVE
ncbi:cysteine peptidase C11 family protein [Dysgonomonas alginatilytica]|uniref:Cysteine peptidase C11 family protein n=1 Tax=Dysgonomonas alginatilytica TaxID=1605892 RepID=A0A2V3PQS5_9BACT|nr:clostripain-related cysteine peptidase [Dysgonomonas alginatilytica]PXV65841.1 cysteine peptidase C11 family protein [Dysgonomonas alginatilytica]